MSNLMNFWPTSGDLKLQSNDSTLRTNLYLFGLELNQVIDLQPIGSMYGIYANIGGTIDGTPNVTIYSIHGSYG